MSKVQAIETAILELSSTERDQLLDRLPKILPQLDGDAAWNRIINGPERPSLNKYIDELEAKWNAGTLELREISKENLLRS